MRDRFFIKTRTVTGAEFEKTALRDFDAVVLANVVDLSPLAADALQAYVRGGGGLLVFPGSRINVPFYNGLLLAERGLLPAAFGPVRGENFDETKAERPEKFFRLQTKDYAHRIVELWKDPASGSLGSAQFYRAFTLQAAKQSDVPALPLAEQGEGGLPAVVLSYADSEPAVMERPFGLGRVVQFSSTADGAWNDLPVRPIFLPLMHRTLGFLLERSGDRLNIRAGTPFTHTVAAERAGKNYTVTGPAPFGVPALAGIGGRATSALPGPRERGTPSALRTRTVMVKNGTPQIEQADTSASGAYAVHFTEETGTAMRFAAASDPSEGDLHELSAADLAALGSTARVVRWTSDTDLRGQMERERNGTELWLPFALAAIGLVVAETLLGNRFSRSK